ncbi:peptide chain release factor 1 [Phormidesmis priestleyi ULC007]|uniref:Peptide chain release factor 1 n=1 Tax=Phormidesmis priestleyi ULC007 TaxID=1920490 RepID=A0A2T1DGW9_9CYAN|nr:peptide chain release factor 1 [Phormidesmis priestleyi]PSB19707.1 peptide chain release factor 1 [Phormidesmis priestleyi ULC007]PZO53591.1 MAG: peptide chain release factor 1 [Phormidesmis priestleyi]
MNDPLRRLKFLPWISLLQISLITVLIAIAFDVLLTQTAASVPVISNLLTKMLSSPIGVLIELAVPLGIGALAVAVLERWFRQVMITNSTLWALIPCVALWLLLKSFVPFPTAMVPEVNVVSLIGVVVGVFWKGRPYWR